MRTKAEMLVLKNNFLKEVRAFFDEQDFVEVNTPVLVKNPGLEPYLIPFESEYIPSMGGGEKIKFYLPTSPEYHLKKALALGLPKVFEICKSFRNGEKSKIHEPEFLMLEWYRHPGTYKNIADDFFLLCQRLATKFSSEIELWATRVDLTVTEAFKKYADRDLNQMISEEDFENTFNFLMVEKIEPALKKISGLVFLWDYPAHFAALSQKKADNPSFAERFEVYFKGVELANAFGELTDPVEQRARCEDDFKKRQEIYGFSPPLDEEFFEALAKLKHPAVGIAVGLERLLQVINQSSRIQDVIGFPHWRTL